MTLDEMIAQLPPDERAVAEAKISATRADMAAELAETRRLRTQAEAIIKNRSKAKSRASQWVYGVTRRSL